MLRYICISNLMVAVMLSNAVAKSEYSLDSDQYRNALMSAGSNSSELRKAVEAVEDRERQGMLFLICNMPERDLTSLDSDFLIENVSYAYRAWDRASWGKKIPNEIFLNNILPYVNINERRDKWRSDFYQKLMPLVQDCRTPSEAAVKLNQEIFKEYGVIFSRERPKADQSPYETIEAGMASCTGLSILFIDACRALGVPARLAGVPLWPDRSGNHSWVEIWDGDWHYTGAAEPNGDELDKAWFSEKVKGAIASEPLHSVYAVSFKKTDTLFPLPWGRNIKYVYAINVTDRYAQGSVEDPKYSKFSKQDVRFDIEASMYALRQLKAYVNAGGDLASIENRPFASVPLTESDSQKATAILWQKYVQEVKSERAGEMEHRVIEAEGMKMPFFYSVNGEPEAGRGRSLFISLHGGGGAPKAVNDQQWGNQKRLYKIDEGVYVAPRAPNDAWNMWFQGHIDAMFDRIIQDMIVFENVDPNRVYLMGYSAGGDGLYRMGPRMADRWAAAAMMAGHPGDASPINLYNTPFTIHVGGNDAAYNRNEEARKWGLRLDKLAQGNPGAYPHWTKIYPGRGHWVDNGAASAIPWMVKHARNPFPSKVIWRQDKHNRFYWLYCEDLTAGDIIEASIDGQTIDLKTDIDRAIAVRLNDDMLDMNKLLTINLNGKEILRGFAKRNIAMIARSIEERGDPSSIFSSEITIQP